jgi:hypothetical protein
VFCLSQFVSQKEGLKKKKKKKEKKRKKRRMQAVEEKKRLFVDFLVIEGRGLLASKDKRFVSVCLESRPDVRLFSRAVSASDYVWNCDGSFLSTAASDRLHVSLVSKKNEVLGKFTIGVRVTGGVVSQWFNLRDCVECACLEDAPLSRPDDPMPFGFSSAGRICVQYEISSRPESMFLAKYGMALRLLPFRIQGAEKAKFVHFLNFFFFFSVSRRFVVLQFEKACHDWNQDCDAISMGPCCNRHHVQGLQETLRVAINNFWCCCERS